MDVTGYEWLVPSDVIPFPDGTPRDIVHVGDETNELEPWNGGVAYEQGM